MEKRPFEDAGCEPLLCRHGHCLKGKPCRVWLVLHGINAHLTELGNESPLLTLSPELSSEPGQAESGSQNHDEEAA